MIGRANVRSSDSGAQNDYDRALIDANGRLQVCQRKRRLCVTRSNWASAVLSDAFWFARRGRQREGAAQRLRLFLEPNLADAALDDHVDGALRLAVGVVHVEIAVAVESVGAYGADAAACLHVHAYVFRQVNLGLADAALNRDVEVRGAIAAKIRVELADAHIQIEALDVHAIQQESVLAGAEIHFWHERN